MTQAQKIIKAFAVALAVFLVVAIFSAIIFAAGTAIGISKLFSLGGEPIEGMQGITTTDIDSVSKMEIDVAATELSIKLGDSFKLETNSKYLLYDIKDNTLKVSEKNRDFFSSRDKEALTIWIPEDTVFQKVEIDAGAGNISIEKLLTKELSLDLGAGNLEIEELYVDNEADVDGGAGKIEVKNGDISNLDLDMGVGKLDLTARLSKKSELDLGVGETDISLIGTAEDYRIALDKGLGSAKLSDSSMKDDTVYGDGENYVDINGGVGSIDICFKAE